MPKAKRRTTLDVNHRMRDRAEGSWARQRAEKPNNGRADSGEAKCELEKRTIQMLIPMSRIAAEVSADLPPVELGSRESALPRGRVLIRPGASPFHWSGGTSLRAEIRYSVFRAVTRLEHLASMSCLKEGWRVRMVGSKPPETTCPECVTPIGRAWMRTAGSSALFGAQLVGELPECCLRCDRLDS